MQTVMTRWLRPGAAAAKLGVGVEQLALLPITRMNVAQPGADRPVWRYLESSIEAFIASRTEAPEDRA